ncbi:S1C family serine protease [Williamsia sterculiae]|uniref:Putative serine protease PepD n=1 Tax=Williamsia sterculiae TaxID=1344003 RepID=A0A1N7DJP6_9NOCA|nr:trypsin-like peptidase domain-containing protein [Williamsia sterculiae]SIR76099.1 putative serine protease PepD [Williamsia sterculiae]
MSDRGSNPGGSHPEGANPGESAGHGSGGERADEATGSSRGESQHPYTPHSGNDEARPTYDQATHEQPPYGQGSYEQGGFQQGGYQQGGGYGQPTYGQTPHDPYAQDPHQGAQQSGWGHDERGGAQQFGGHHTQQFGTGQQGTGQFGQQYGTGQWGTFEQQGAQPSYGNAPYGAGPQQIGAQPKKKGRGGLITGVALAAVALCALAGLVGGVIGASVSDGSGSNDVVLGGDRDTSQPAAATPGSTQQVASKVLPSVVSIDVRVGNQEGEGSGVVLSQDGLILTNNHVVSADNAGTANSLVVTFNDGSTAKATVKGTDPISDIAVIKTDKSGLTPITVGTSKNLAVGQNVVAVGAPLGLAGTVTTGIISALNRPVSTQGPSDSTASVIDAIQTDAAINPGNSGGALVNANGALIGVNTAIASLGGSSESQQSGSIGLGFAIPVDQAMRTAQQLESTGKATQAGLGVSVRPTSSADQPGALISEVQRGGAAGKAGIPRGALVTKVDDRTIASGDALVAAIRSHAPGDQVTITYTTGGQTKTAQVTLDTLSVN